MLAKFWFVNGGRESPVQALVRTSRAYAALFLAGGAVLAMLFGTYMLAGLRDLSEHATGREGPWSLLWGAAFFFLAVRPAYRAIERTFSIAAVVFCGSLVLCVLTVRPHWSEVAAGLASGAVDGSKIFLAVGLLGALGGSLVNFVYPYFLAEKGWRDPKDRGAQQRDLSVAVGAMLLINLCAWILGATFAKKGLAPSLRFEEWLLFLESHLSPIGYVLLQVGVVAAIATSLVGIVVGLPRLFSESVGAWTAREVPRSWVAAWILGPPQLLLLMGDGEFVGLTLLGSIAQVVLLPLLLVGTWWITSRTSYVAGHVNGWLARLVFGALLLLSLTGAAMALWSH